jgi:hypothetical protein
MGGGLSPATGQAPAMAYGLHESTHQLLLLPHVPHDSLTRVVTLSAFTFPRNPLN